VADDCPPIELLAASIDQILASDHRASIEAHLVKCLLCRKTLALAIKSERTVPDPIRSEPTQ
jgi:hypothetical protein